MVKTKLMRFQMALCYGNTIDTLYSVSFGNLLVIFLTKLPVGEMDKILITTVLINGSPMSVIPSMRCLKRDPLSSYLFVMVMKSLSY